MNSIEKLAYELRITIGAAMGLPPLILMVAAAYLVYRYNPEFADFIQPMSARIMNIFQLGLPLVVPVAIAHMMTVEDEDDFTDLRHTLPEPTWHRFGYRLWLAIMLMIVTAGIAGLIFFIGDGAFDFSGELRQTALRTLYLMMISLTLSVITRNYWIAMGVVIGYWFMDFTSNGSITRVFYLFENIRPATKYPDLNALVLFLMIALLLLISLWCMQQRRRGNLL